MGDLLTPELQEQAPVEPEYKPRRMVLNMGPQHPSTHGVLRLKLELDGETVLKAEPDIGYLHTGIEKEFESKTWRGCWILRSRRWRNGCASCWWS